MPTHFIRRLNMREQLIREVEIIPLEVVVRNVAAGSLSTRLGIEEGTALPRSIVEFYYKNDKLGDPMVTEEHITAFGWATPQEIDDIMSLALRVNDFLSGLFLGVGIRLVDFKIEFGRLWENDTMRIIVADEISPDCCRLWDVETRNKLDKDRFRRDMGGLVEAYQEVARRLGLHVGQSMRTRQARCCVRSKCRTAKAAMKARVTVTLKAGVLDPQGKAIAGALACARLRRRRQCPPGQVYRGRARRGATRPAPGPQVERMCEKLLANTVIENYAYELEAA